MQDPVIPKLQISQYWIPHSNTHITQME